MAVRANTRNRVDPDRGFMLAVAHHQPRYSVAQWSGQFSGNTHASRVEDLEDSLRAAVHTLKAATADPERLTCMNDVRQLAEKLYKARIRLLRARLAAEPPSGADLRHSGLERRLVTALEGGVSAILQEFGVPK